MLANRNHSAAQILVPALLCGPAYFWVESFIQSFCRATGEAWQTGVQVDQLQAYQVGKPVEYWNSEYWNWMRLGCQCMLYLFVYEDIQTLSLYHWRIGSQVDFPNLLLLKAPKSLPQLLCCRKKSTRSFLHHWNKSFTDQFDFGAESETYIKTWWVSLDSKN
jgi:hypothetical protein